MAFKFWDILRGKTENGDVTVVELYRAAREFQIRELAFWTCVDMIANALGRCDFRVYQNNAEVQNEESYLWNVEPNVNQNSTAFLHQLVARLCLDNEALIVTARKRKGNDALVVADSWEKPEEWPDRMHEYRGVTAGEYHYNRTIYERDVLHLTLHHLNLRPIVQGIADNWAKMVTAAADAYQKGNGERWKVHVSAMARADKEWKAAFDEMLEKQIRPFLNAQRAVLPEFDGYDFQNVTEKSGGSGVKPSDLQTLEEEIFADTARAFLIPAVLVNGKVEGTKDANERFLTYCLDPICDQLQEEINRKRFGYELWREGTRMQVDTSAILHYDMFANAANLEKLVGSGAFTINDIRRSMGQPAIAEAWADEHYMTLNIAKASEQTQKMTDGGDNE